jgi:hypothetical protein
MLDYNFSITFDMIYVGFGSFYNIYFNQHLYQEIKKIMIIIFKNYVCKINVVLKDFLQKKFISDDQRYALILKNH